VTTAEALKMAIGSFGIDVGSAASGEPWYQPFVDFVHDNGIFSKYGLLSSRNITRGEMAYLIHKLMLNKDGSVPFNGTRTVASA
jgi:hypothetical protein